MSRRTWILVAVPVVLVLGLVLGPLAYAALQDDAPPAETVQAQAEDAELVAQTDGTWTVGDGSSAGYRVDEVLNGADVTVAGTTDQVTGTVVVEDGVLSTAEVTVDVASITTDSGRRDSYFRDSVMDVGQHPTAAFVVTGPVDLPELTGTPTTVPVTGELTLTGETREVQVDLGVVRTPNGVDISGSIPVTFADFGIEAPDLGFVRVEDQGSIEFLLLLET
ncbi:YceI family protein [Blastococcus haudaquaticus]|uniref:Polyisoprenoid-binding protein YceI n=1 Tax=Blastococcus haudaquaticus TaxID=1938745 RepID=A0A286GYD8_9ACTN|nr:YceI family protein [Blastococcus haudaquaticus]SOE00502.1 Polyisoprenoid-binding protein YceI [Blastococcus haudaquaticus]